MKKHFDTVYLLTDFSDHAKNAARYAINAFGTEVKYVLINSYVVRSTAATLIDLEEMAHQESVDNLASEAKAIRADFPDKTIDLETISRMGKTVDVVNYYLTTDIPADVVVVGSKGISKLDEFLIGSVTTSVMRGVAVPVLSVPLNAQFKQMDHLVMASDLVNANKDSALDTVESFKAVFDARVTGVTVTEKMDQLTSEQNDLLNQLKSVESMDNVAVLEGKDTSRALLDFCEENNADMLIVVAKHTSFFKRFFHKSITKELVNFESLPILVLEDN